MVKVRINKSLYLSQCIVESRPINYKQFIIKPRSPAEIFKLSNVNVSYLQ